MSRFWPGAVLVLLICGCGASAVRQVPSPKPEPPPAAVVVTPATYSTALRSYHILDYDHPYRAPLRQRLVDYLFERAGEVLAQDDYDGVVEVVADVMDLYTPEELSRGDMPGQLEPLAEYLSEKGGPRGDEGRVLSGLLILGSLRPDDVKVQQYYERLKKWGREVRSNISDPVDRFQGLISSWQEHARLTPTPDVLRTLARLYLDRCKAVLQEYRSAGPRLLLGTGAFQTIQESSLLVAAVFLRHGDFASASSYVEPLRGTGAADDKLLELLRAAREGGEVGAGATWDLARVYVKERQPDVAVALCRSGLRRNRSAPRFPRCLAQIAAVQDDFEGAMDWYARAIEMAPEERTLYDETLEVLNHLIEQERYSADPSISRRLANRATEVLKERTRRWSGSPSPVKPETLQYAIAIAEMNAGNTSEAESRLRASIDARETVKGLLQLGLLVERTGRGEEAAGLYRRALELIPDKSLDDSIGRAEVLERVGDAFRLAGQPEQRQQSYLKALELWDAILPGLKESVFGLAQVRRGVLLGRLGRRGDSVKAFDLAMQYAPGSREIYTSILAYLVVSEPNSAFGHEVHRRALRQIDLEPEWKVYFSLWVQTIAERAGTGPEPEVRDVLQELSVGSAWWAKLARFGAGESGYAELLSQASGLGERAEAHFYEAARRLGAGNLAGARQLFVKVLQTQMVNFYEFTMAQELLGTAEPASAEPRAEH